MARENVGVVCIGYALKAEKDEEVLIFMPNNNLKKIVVESSYCGFVSKVRQYLSKNNVPLASTHFDFDTLPTISLSTDEVRLDTFKPLAQGCRDTFLNQFFP